MRVKMIAFTLTVASLIAVVYSYHRSVATTAAVRSAQTAVDTLYRNSAHTLPATDLTAKKLAHAKALLRKTQSANLSNHQKTQLQKANTELSAATQMYSVTHATKTPIAPTPDYQQTAKTALNAYQQLQKAKPVFTQIYQQPVANLNQAAKAVDALNDLQQANQVSKAAIKSAQDQVEQVTDGQDTAFAAEAAQVVSEAEQKVSTPEADPDTTPVNDESTTSATTSSSTSISAADSSSTSHADATSQSSSATSTSASTATSTSASQ